MMWEEGEGRVRMVRRNPFWRRGEEVDDGERRESDEELFYFREYGKGQQSSNYLRQESNLIE